MTEEPICPAAPCPKAWVPHEPEEPRHCQACGGTLGRRLVKPGEPERHVCDACGRIHFLDPKVAACVIPERDGKLLLCQRGISPGKGKWVVPGGFVDRGELPWETARREAREETGLEVAPGELLGVFGTRDRPILIVYLSAEVEGEARAEDETLAVRWVPGDEIPWDELAFPSTRQCLSALALLRGWPAPKPEDP
ncbi:MAG: NUDIX hydrolase [Polyangia bacterium]|jgi:ADP-ribose pyrophosphatase YjhB (NUDIX family)|nr:NUDIX hydrolase [Polyangia bacterium]